MYSPVRREQFEIRDGIYVHTPTQAEFTPHPNNGSLLIYTANIGRQLENGELFDYAEVLAVMQTLWRGASIERFGLELTEA